MVVTVEWDNGPASVFVPQDWQQSATARELLTQAQQQVNEHLAAGRSPSWRSQLSLANVPIDQLREFNALIEEARQEEKASPQQEVVEVQTRNLTSRWLDGHLIALQADPAWVASTGRQRLVDELLEVLTPPPADDASVSTTARDRLVRFMEG